MPELFDEGPSEDEFSLPGDEATLERMRAAAEAPDAPATDTPAAPAPAAQPADDTPQTDEEGPALDVDDPEVQAFLEKYGGDQEKALRAAVESQRLIGQQGQELGELRRWANERLAEEQAAAQPRYDPSELEDFFLEHPTRIPEVAETAFYANDQTVLDAAVAAWKETDRAAASQFERWMVSQQVRADVYAEQASREQVAADWNTAAGAFAQAHPDLEQLAPKMLEVAPRYPSIVHVLRSGDPQSKLEVLDFLYEKARGQTADTLASTAREIAREQAQGAQQAIKDAAVASAATAVPARQTDIAARIAAEWDTLDRPYADGEDGWNV